MNRKFFVLFALITITISLNTISSLSSPSKAEFNIASLNYGKLIMLNLDPSAKLYHVQNGIENEVITSGDKNICSLEFGEVYKVVITNYSSSNISYNVKLKNILDTDAKYCYANFAIESHDTSLDDLNIKDFVPFKSSAFALQSYNLPMGGVDCFVFTLMPPDFNENPDLIGNGDGTITCQTSIEIYTTSNN